jgi:hypothetical protein
MEAQVLFCNNTNPNPLYQLTRNKHNTEKTVLFLEYPGKHGFLLPGNCTNGTIHRLPSDPLRMHHPGI